MRDLTYSLIKLHLQVFHSVIPSEDAHGSLNVEDGDKRREFISGLTTSAGDAIVTRDKAYIVIHTQHWEQVRKEVDDNWTLICTGFHRPKDWVEWLSVSIAISFLAHRLTSSVPLPH